MLARSMKTLYHVCCARLRELLICTEEGGDRLLSFVKGCLRVSTRDMTVEKWDGT
jgi:hypothetical protein